MEKEKPIQVKNNIFIEHIRDGVVIDRLEVHNIIVNAGLPGLASRLGGIGGVAAFTYIAIGTGTTAAAVGNTALQTEITTGGGQRVSVTPTLVTTAVANDTLELANTFAFTSSFNVSEIGVLNAASSGTLLNRKVFTAFPVANGDRLRTVVQFQFV